MLPLAYVLRGGITPGGNDVGSLPLSPQTTTFSATAPNGTFYVRAYTMNVCGALGPASNEVTLTIGGPAPALPGAPTALAASVIDAP